MSVQPLSESTEMYLKAMVELGSRDVPIPRLAERLSVTNVSANEMMRRLAEQGLVTHTPYKGVTLTKKGKEVAVNVIRRQRLWECFLYDHLKIEWSKVYEFACSLEHATAPEVTEALAGFLNHPLTCPRGNPIPDEHGVFAPLKGRVISELKPGESATVLAVSATDTEVLKYLQDKKILPGQELKFIEAAPFQGPLTVSVNGKEVALGLSLVDYVIVK
ncbi:MAG TPA: metal-dependent transcriptional regulator [Anaerolineales bacterium]|nr:metal-dependent transcriptional regulator [Anaerolineales bacterium]